MRALLVLAALTLVSVTGWAAPFDDSAPTTVNFDATAPGAIGGVTPGAGAFTTLSATSTVDAKTQLFVNNSSGNGTAFTGFTENGTSRTPGLVLDLPDVTNNVNAVFSRYTSTATRTAQLYFLRARGTQASPTVSSSGDLIGKLSFDTWDGAQWQSVGSLFAAVDGTIATGKAPGRLDFSPVTAAGNSHVQFSVQSHGNEVFTTPTLAATELVASTEQPAVDINDASTKTFPTGDFATQRAVVVRAPTYAATAASTITNAATLDVTAAPTCNANMTCTNKYALRVEAGSSLLAGGVTTSGNNPVTLSTGSAATTITATAATAAAGLRVGATRVIVRNASVAPVDVSAGATLTVSQLLDAGIFTSTGTATVVMPTFQGASGVIQALPGTPAVGDLFTFEIADSSATLVVTITPGAGQTLFGLATTAVGGGNRSWTCRVTSVVASSETATCY